MPRIVLKRDAKAGESVDVKDVDVLPSDTELAAVLVGVGDGNANGKADITVAGGAYFPLAGVKAFPTRTQDLPLKDSIHALRPLAKAISVPMVAAGADAFLGVVEGAAAFVEGPGRVLGLLRGR